MLNTMFPTINRESSMLGFGCMRFTRKGRAFDIDKAEKEVLCAAWRAAGCPGVEND